MIQTDDKIKLLESGMEKTRWSKLQLKADLNITLKLIKSIPQQRIVAQKRCNIGKLRPKELLKTFQLFLGTQNTHEVLQVIANFRPQGIPQMCIKVISTFDYKEYLRRTASYTTYRVLETP
ncbi:hypothetical protein CHS0354_015272, partial [Potamilus streckersoni]